jgi:hypothetical protein
MSINEIEAAVLKLAPSERAHLAEKLPESLDQLSAEENEKLWAQEPMRRDQEWDLDPKQGRPAADVFRDTFARLK